METHRRSCAHRIALGLIAFGSILGIVLLSPAIEAGMENAVFSADYKPMFVPSKTLLYLCDNPATTTEEPNYSPNYTITLCLDYTVGPCPLGPGHVYVVIAKAGLEGVAAASFGVSYGGSAGVGIDPQLVTWTPCADGSSFPNNDGVHGDFPQPGGGVRITWNLPGSCQTRTIPPYGVHAVLCAFYIYAFSDDVLRLTPNNNLQGGPEVVIADCAGKTTDLIDLWGAQIVSDTKLARIGFGHQFGLEPCEVNPVTPTTWGKMKSMYKGTPQ